ncbi:hypothetical protein [Winogradskyella ouciana]|uniref:hypothetical protein n=1 Tax=Winogradskyella ouciana TaxID=2608631 RepID=UPI003D2C67B8
MKTIKLIYLLLLISFFGYSQVGVGNTDPKASLDVTASNTATPANTDGILIPRIDTFPTTNPTADQDGMMVFVTGNGTPAKGFYYWDNGNGTWVNVLGVRKINDLEDAKSDNDGSDDGSSIYIGEDAGSNDDQSNNNNVGLGKAVMYSNTSGNYNVGIGFQSLLFNTTGVNNTAVGTQSLLDNNGDFNTAVGTYAINSNIGGDSNTAVGWSALSSIVDGNGNTAIGNNAGFGVNGNSSNNIFIGNHSGYKMPVGNRSGSIFIGYFAGSDETNNNRLYIENSNADENNALIYGEFDSNLLRTNGEFQIGNPSTTGYALPTTDGANGQILGTDGAGQINFINPSSIFTDNTNTLDQAYDQSVPSPNQGATIVADNGPVSITGGDGFNVRGDFGASGSVVLAPPNDKSLMFFNPFNAVFRAGFNEGTDWIYSNQGNYSTALGYSPLATGERTFATGSLTQATGDRSTAMGNGTIAASFAETTLGNFNTNYTPDNTSAFDSDDRLFVVGNGTSDAARHNALTIYKNGLLNINEAYNLPATDGTNGQVLATDGAGQTNFVDASTVFIDNDTQNTLDQAYNEGGAGAGKEIIANNGAVTINGTDGFFVTGTYGFGNTIDDEITGTGTRMFFNPRKAAFRAGYVSGNQWNNANVGDNSAAFGYNTQAEASYSTAFGVYSTASGAGSTAFGNETLASGSYSTAFGYDTQAVAAYSTAFGVNSTASGSGSTAFGDGTFASGSYSTAFGHNTNASGGYSTTFGEYTNASGATSTAFGYNTTASGENSSVLGIHTISPSYGETVIGLYNTNYSVSSATNFNPNDRVFSIGNGSSVAARSNALTIYKNGTMNINDAYNMPLTDGTNGQVMTTDGAGNVTFQNATVNTDNQQIDNLALTGTSLSISLQNDGVAPVMVDLTSINTDNQQIDNLALSGTSLGISLQNDGVAPATVDLSSINTDNQQIDNLGLVGTILGISLEDDGIAPVTVDLSSIDTDNQEVDTFSFNSSNNILTLEVEDDGQAAHTVDLSSLNPTKSLARIVMAADQNFTISGWQKINFNSVDFDTNGDFNVTTDTFVAPADGYYRINASWRSDGNSTSTGFFGIGIYRNGLVVRGNSYNHTGNGQIIRYINNLIQLDAGDTIEIYINVLAPLTISLNDVAASFEIEQVQ